MSGLMRNVIDQVMRSMGEEERARSVEYVTDRMIEKMDNTERASLLLAIVDRVINNLTPSERSAFTAALAAQLGAGPAGDMDGTGKPPARDTTAPGEAPLSTNA